MPSTTTTTSRDGSRPRSSSGSMSATPHGQRSRSGSTGRTEANIERPMHLPEALPATAAVTVSAVVQAESPDGIAGFHMTCPQAGHSERVYSLPLEGWVVPERVRATTLKVRGVYRPVPTAAIEIVRED